MRPAALSVAGILIAASVALAFRANPAAESIAPATTVPAPLAAEPAATGEPLEDAWLGTWRRPAGPVKIALQAGHWRAHEAPDEQEGLRGNGTRGGGKAEWEVNLEIARRTAVILEDSGYTVEILPTTIPPAYWADLFISIHADGHSSSRISGYRAAPPRRDATGRAAIFAELLDRTYGQETGLPYYGSVTRRMRGYYAFNYRRYDHALHPMTVGVILETGFLTSPRDRGILVESPDRAARGIARAVSQFVSPIPPVSSPTVTRPLTLSPHRALPRQNADQAR
jgi:N-acetylmuramoyl-L-alanine amidase